MKKIGPAFCFRDESEKAEIIRRYKCTIPSDEILEGNLKRRVKELRKKLHISQKDLADIVDVSLRTIEGLETSGICNGITVMRLNQLFSVYKIQ